MNHKDTRHSSQIWGKRKRLLTNLEQWLTIPDKLDIDPPILLAQEEIIDLLDSNQTRLIDSSDRNACLS